MGDDWWRRVGFAGWVDAALETRSLLKRCQVETPGEAVEVAGDYWRQNRPTLIGELLILHTLVRKRKDDHPWAVVGAALAEILVRLTRDDPDQSEEFTQTLEGWRAEYPSNPDFDAEVEATTARITTI